MYVSVKMLIEVFSIILLCNRHFWAVYNHRFTGNQDGRKDYVEIKIYLYVFVFNNLEFACLTKSKSFTVKYTLRNTLEVLGEMKFILYSCSLFPCNVC